MKPVEYVSTDLMISGSEKFTGSACAWIPVKGKPCLFWGASRLSAGVNINHCLYNQGGINIIPKNVTCNVSRFAYDTMMYPMC